LANHIQSTVQDLFEMVNVLDFLTTYHFWRTLTRVNNYSVSYPLYPAFSFRKTFINNYWFSAVRALRWRHWWYV